MHVSVPNDSCVLVHYIISALKMIKSAIYQKRKKNVRWVHNLSW